MEKAAFIQAKDVWVNSGNTPALKGVSLNLYPGEIAVMMGSNDAGKSTFLRSLVGLVPIRAGSISVGAKDIVGRSIADICKYVGYLPQDPNALLFVDTVSEELLTTLRNHQLDITDPAHQPYILLERLGLADKANAYPRDSSTGERQRVATRAQSHRRQGARSLHRHSRCRPVFRGIGAPLTCEVTLFVLPQKCELSSSTPHG